MAVGLRASWLLPVGLLVFFADGFDITILHTNDIHARIEQTNKRSGQCTEELAKKGECFGGYARIKTKVNEIRASTPNTLFLDAGDQYSGTLWFYKFRGAGVATFTSHLGYDAMTIGNHEFDKGEDGIVPFLDGVNFPVVSSNIRLTPQSKLHGKFKKSHVFTVGGEKIGVIGYTTQETKSISRPGPYVIFEDEVAAIRQEVNALQQQGVNKIIALGHSGFEIDKTIAREIEGIDLVIGGHDNTFLYTGEKPSIEMPKGMYPHVVTQSNGAKVLVVQDYAFGKYLGNLQVTFDEQGAVTAWGGNPILLDNSIPRDPDTLAFLKPYKDQVYNETLAVVGRTHVFLDGERGSCRLKECSLGNVITDAMVRQNIKHSDSSYWNNVSIAIANAGGIRSSIEQGDITIAHIATVLPFSNTIDIVELKGKHLKAALEHSVSKHGSEKRFGGFLQVSGLKVEYDVDREVGSRVTRARALCTRCTVPTYEDVKDDVVYQVIMPSYIGDGGDFYDVINDNKVRHHRVGDLDLDVMVEYVSQYSPIIQGEEERIVFKSSTCKPNTSATISRLSHLTLFAAALLVYLISQLHRV